MLFDVTNHFHIGDSVASDRDRDFQHPAIREALALIDTIADLSQVRGTLCLNCGVAHRQTEMNSFYSTSDELPATLGSVVTGSPGNTCIISSRKIRRSAS